MNSPEGNEGRSKRPTSPKVHDAADVSGSPSDTAKPEDVAFRLSQSPSHLLRRAQQHAAEIFARAGIEDAVTLRQTVVLAAIAEAEGSSQAELVIATGIDRSTLAEMMARMERRKLVERIPAPSDLRAKAVRLTSLGRTRLADALPAMQQADEQLLAALPRTRRKSFSDALAVLSQAGVVAAEAELARVRADKAASRLARSAEKARRKQRKKQKKKKR